MEYKSDIYMSMIETAETVSKRYNISRDKQDEYALQSQVRTFEAQQAGFFDKEIIPIKTKMAMQDKDSKDIYYHQVELSKDECNRPRTTTLDGLNSLKPVLGTR